MTTTIILLNGEKEVGKSRFAKELRDQLNAGWHPTIAGTFSLIAPVHEAVVALYEWCVNSDRTEWDAEYINRIKNEFFAGSTGREWMIMLGDAFRRHDEDAFIRISLAHLHSLLDPLDFAIFDNWGFENELLAFQRLMPKDWRLERIHLNARAATRDHQAGMQYPDDNRFNLMHLCDWVNPSVRHIADYLQPSVSHTSLRDSFDATGEDLIGFEQRLKAAVDAVIEEPTRDGIKHVSEIFDSEIHDNHPLTSASKKA